jgi:hypothetical protein
MEGMKGWARDEGRLVGDPEMLDRIEGIGKNNALSNISQLRFSPTTANLLCFPT